MSRNSGREGPDADGTQAAAVWHYSDARPNRPSALPDIGPWCNRLYGFCMPRWSACDGGHYRISGFSCRRTTILGRAKGTYSSSLAESLADSNADCFLMGATIARCRLTRCFSGGRGASYGQGSKVESLIRSLMT